MCDDRLYVGSENATTGMNDTVLVNVNVGHCTDNYLIVDETFGYYYQKAYGWIYVICLLVVIVLYVAVFAAVLRQRRRRQMRHRNQYTATTNAITTMIVETKEPGGGKRDDPEHITRTEKKEDDAGVVDGAELTVVAKTDRKSSAVVQTSRSNIYTHRGPSAVVQTSKSDKHQQWESTLLANLRTASTLFVVTVVFIVTFTPGFLMSL